VTAYEDGMLQMIPFLDSDWKTNLGSLRNGMLGKLTRKDEADRSLNLTRGDSGLLVVSGKLGGLGRNTLKDV